MTSVCRKTFSAAPLGAVFVVALTVSPLLQTRSHAEESRKMLVYIGTYTRGDADGVFICRFDPSNGGLEKIGSVGGVRNPSFLAIHPNKKFLYAVSEIGDFGGKQTGGVFAYAINAEDGSLTPLNHQPSQGTAPCHITVDPSGKSALVANYSSGSVAVLPIADDGSLQEPSCTIQHEGSGVNPRRQEGPHAHSINLDPANRFAFAADLGLDKVLIYRLSDDKKTLTPAARPFVSVDPGSGPRHFAFHPNGKNAYVINELSSTITAFDYDPPAGTLSAIQTISTLPEGYEGSTTTAEVQVHPSGRFVYGSNRGHDSIAVFRVDTATGRLTAAGHASTTGKTPRNFGIDPTGKYMLVANQDTDDVVVFRIDAETGGLTPTGVKLEVPHPVCVKFLSTH